MALPKQNKIPYERTVFVCTNVRTDGRAACANAGCSGKEICEALKEKIKVMGLKEKIRVVRSGCLDRCAQGPNIFVYPEGNWYSQVKLEDIDDLTKEIFKV